MVQVAAEVVEKLKVPERLEKAQASLTTALRHLDVTMANEEVEIYGDAESKNQNWEDYLFGMLEHELEPMREIGDMEVPKLIGLLKKRMKTLMNHYDEKEVAYVTFIKEVPEKEKEEA
jgi:hypothetical protein